MPKDASGAAETAVGLVMLVKVGRCFLICLFLSPLFMGVLHSFLILANKGASCTEASRLSPLSPLTPDLVLFIPLSSMKHEQL